MSYQDCVTLQIIVNSILIFVTYYLGYAMGKKSK